MSDTTSVDAGRPGGRGRDRRWRPRSRGRRAGPTVGRLDALALDDPDALRRAVEAVLFVVDAPVSADALAAALQRPVPDVEAALAELRDGLDGAGSGIELREVARRCAALHPPEWSPAVEAFLLEGQRNTAVAGRAWRPSPSSPTGSR